MNELELSGKCPVCGGVIAPDDDVTACNRCTTAHHRECWDYVGGCSIFACDGRLWRSSKNGVLRREFRDALERWFSAFQTEWQGVGIIATGSVVFFLGLAAYIFIVTGLTLEQKTAWAKYVHFFLLPGLFVCTAGVGKFIAGGRRAGNAIEDLDSSVREELPGLSDLAPADFADKVHVTRSYRLGELALNVGAAIAGLLTLVAMLSGFAAAQGMQILEHAAKQLSPWIVAGPFFLILFYLAGFLLRRRSVGLETIRNRVETTLERLKDKTG